MEMTNRPGTLYIRKSDERIRLVAVFAFLIVVCMPFHTLTIGGIGLLLLLGIPLLVLCSPILAKDLGKQLWDKATVFLALFFIYGACAFLWAPTFSMSSLYDYVKKVAIVMCLYCLPLNGREKKLLLGGAVIAGLIVSWFMMTGQQVIEFEGRMLFNVFGVEQDPNYLGLVFIPPMAIAVHQCMNAKSMTNRLLSLLLAGIIVYCVLLTGSRGALFGIATVAIVAIVSRFHTLGGKIAFCTIAGILLIRLFDFVLLFLPEELSVRFTVQNMTSTGGTGRIDIWLDTLQIMRAAPHRVLFGFGASSSIPLIGVATHNYILQLLFEYGIVGTVLFLGFLWMWLKRMFSQDAMCLSIVLGCMMMAMTLSVNAIYYFWVSMMIGIICSKVRVPYGSEVNGL